MYMDIKNLFDKFGISYESISRIRVGRGVAGKLCTIVLVVVFVLGALAFRLNDFYVTIGFGGIIILFAFYVIIRILSFADKHPDVAILEGAEFLIYHGKMSLGTKELPSPPKSAQIPVEEQGIDIEDTEEKPE